VEELRVLNDNSEWRSILGIARADKNQKDVELVLRLFALFEVWNDYEKPMLRYLNRQMAANREFTSERAVRFSSRFPEVVTLVSRTLTRPFRPRSVINSAMLEGVMVALLEDRSIDSERLKRGYKKLEADETFDKLNRGATTDTLTVRERIKRAKETLANA
jgi:hypothetical protein